ncbi:MAG: tail fiber protein [Candidatus Altiarchaeia archaeon]
MKNKSRKLKKMHIVPFVLLFCLVSALICSGNFTVRDGQVLLSDSIETAGDINVYGSGSKVYAPELCIAGTCRTTWSGGLTGEVRMFARNNVPSGWLACEGQELNIADYPALYAVIGIAYGGDGDTTFKLPDLRGRSPIGGGQGDGLTDRSLGEMGGNESENLTLSQMPLHTHTGMLKAYAAGNGDSSTPSGNVFGIDPSRNRYSLLEGSLSMANGSIETLNAGSGYSHENMQPYLVIAYIIKT